MQPSSAIISHHQPSSAVSSALIALMLTVNVSVFAADINKANNTNNWADTASWVGGTLPTSADTVIYDSTVTGPNNSNITTANANIGMLKILNPGGLITIRDNTLNISGVTVSGTNIGIDMRGATHGLVLNTTVNPVASQSWYLGGNIITLLKIPTNLFTNNIIMADSGILASNQNITYSANTPWSFSGTWRQINGSFAVTGSGLNLGELNMSRSALTIGTTAAAAIDRVNAATNLRLGGYGGASLTVSAASADVNEQTFASLTLDTGYHQITTSAAGVLKLDAYNRKAGGFVNFVGTNVQLNSLTGGGVFNNKLLVGAILGKTDFVQATAGGNISTATYTNDTLGTGVNTQLTASKIAADGDVAQSLRFGANNTTLTLDGKFTVESGGILLPNNMNSTISGGTLTGGNGNLWIYTDNYTLTVNSVIADNGATPLALEKFGGGSLTLAGANTFTGEVLFQGNLNINNAAALGTGSAAIRNITGLDNNPEPIININTDFTTDRGLAVTRNGLSYKINVASGKTGVFNGDVVFLDSEEGPGLLSGMNFIKQNSGTLTLSGNLSGNVSRINVAGGALILTGTVRNTLLNAYNIDGESASLIVSGNGAIIRAGGGDFKASSVNKPFTVTFEDDARFEDSTGINVGNTGSNSLILNITDRASFKSGNLYFGGAFASNTMTISLSGSLAANGQFRLGNGVNSDSVLTLQNNARLTATEFSFLVDSGTSTATLTVKDSAVLQAGNIYGHNGTGTNSVLNVHLQNSGTILSSDKFQLGRVAASLTVFNQTGGWLEGNSINLGTDATGTVIYNLNGGMMRSNGDIFLGASDELLMNGGTLSEKNTRSLQRQGDGNVGMIKVGAGGATFDVDAGTTLFVRHVPILHDSALGATADGGFVKTGSGKVEFDGSSSGSWTGDTVIKGGSLQFDTIATGTSFWTGGGALRFADAGGIFQYSNSDLTVTGISTEGSAAATIQNVTALTLNGSGSYRYNGTIQNIGATTLTKTGAGTQEIAGAYNATGAVTVSGGVLLVNTDINKSAAVTVSGGVFNYEAATALTRNVTVSGGEFKYNSALYTGTLTYTAGVISGTGNVQTTALTIGAGKTIAPGNSVGSLVTGAQTWQDGGEYLWELADLTGSVGSGWDSLLIAGNLDLSALSAGGFTLTLNALGGFNPLAGDYTGANALAIAYGAIISGFDAGNFTLVNNISELENLSLTADANNLYLNFTVIPEPSTWTLLMTGAALLALLRRRR
jgi:autotransporter-associated beta strand protein